MLLAVLLAQINGEQVDPLATIVHRDDAYRVGKGLVKRLKELIPRQQFKVPIQAAIGARIVASEAISGAALPRAQHPGHFRAVSDHFLEDLSCSAS